MKRKSLPAKLIRAIGKKEKVDYPVMAASICAGRNEPLDYSLYISDVKRVLEAYYSIELADCFLEPSSPRMYTKKERRLMEKCMASALALIDDKRFGKVTCSTPRRFKDVFWLNNDLQYKKGGVYKFTIRNYVMKKLAMLIFHVCKWVYEKVTNDYKDNRFSRLGEGGYSSFYNLVQKVEEIKKAPIKKEYVNKNRLRVLSKKI